jgi:hypothetical protein
MSCHSPAQDTFKSFLLPAPNPKKTDTALYVYTPGSANWNLWFRDDYGNVPFDKGQVAMDYDMVMAFKSLRAYNKAHKPEKYTLLRENFEAIDRFRQHNTKK